jgi:hypothetical protein
MADVHWRGKGEGGIIRTVQLIAEISVPAEAEKIWGQIVFLTVVMP